MRGNVVDMAVGIIIGALSVRLWKSMVDDVLMPPIGLLLVAWIFLTFCGVKRGAKAAAPYHNLLMPKPRAQ